MMASSSTMRFPESLKSEATAYAESLGVSLNALCAIALRDYLDARKGRAAETTPPAVAEPSGRAPLPTSMPMPPADEPGGVRVNFGEVLRAAVPPVRRGNKKRKKR